MKFFQRSLGLEIGVNDLMTIAGNVSDSALVDANRPKYLRIHSDDLKEWLAFTKIDENIWREASLTNPKMTVTEFVCVEFASFLVACIEPQERVKQGLPYPLAICRVMTQDHELAGYIDEDSEFALIEPQNDDLLNALRFERAQADNQINKMFFA